MAVSEIIDRIDVGIPGRQGEPGPRGPAGVESVDSVGLPEGAQPTIALVDGKLTLGIPKGAKGDTGAAATIEIGAVKTGDAGTQASITNSGTDGAAVFDFVIPRGDKGEQGDGLHLAYTADTVGALPTTGVADAALAMVGGILYCWNGTSWGEQGDVTGGAQLDNYYTIVAADAKFAAKTDIPDAYSKTESDGRYALIGNVYDKKTADSTFVKPEDIPDSYTKVESDAKYALATAIPDAYTKAETYSSAEIDALLEDAAGKARTQQVTFTAASFAGSTKVRKTGLTLGDVNFVVAQNTDDMIEIVSACGARLMDSSDDSTIPAGAVDCEVTSTPTGDMVFTIVSFDAEPVA